MSQELHNPKEIIETMIDLRIQVAHLEQQIQDLQPAFQAACKTLNIEKMAMERAIITRKLTPGEWTYSSDILQQQDLVRELKRQFQLDHEPTGGRNITWIIKLILEKFS